MSNWNGAIECHSRRSTCWPDCRPRSPPPMIHPGCTEPDARVQQAKGTLHLPDRDLNLCCTRSLYFSFDVGSNPAGRHCGRTVGRRQRLRTTAARTTLILHPIGPRTVAARRQNCRCWSKRKSRHRRGSVRTSGLPRRSPHRRPWIRHFVQGGHDELDAGKGVELEVGVLLVEHGRIQAQRLFESVRLEADFEPSSTVSRGKGRIEFGAEPSGSAGGAAVNARKRLKAARLVAVGPDTYAITSSLKR